MATNKEIALAFVDEYLSTDPEFLSVAEFMDDTYPSDYGEEVLYSTVYDEVSTIMGMVRDRLDLITEGY